MIDKELVTRKVVLITEDLRALRPLADKPRADYLASPTDEVLAERYLERIIGGMIDINYHVLTESGQAPPRDYPSVLHGAGRHRHAGPRVRDAHGRLRGLAQPDHARIRDDRPRAAS